MRAELKYGSAFVACALLALGSAEGLRARRQFVAQPVDVAHLAPARAGEWKLAGGAADAVSAAPDDLIGTGTKQYDAILARTYINSQGARIVLMLAYKSHQEQENKVHRPEICYVAQGYRLIGQHGADQTIAGRDVRVRYFSGRGIERAEEVAYWIRSGTETVSDGWGLRFSLVRAAAHGAVPDGLLVRASIANDDPANGIGDRQKMLTAFLRSLVTALPAARQADLVGPRTADDARSS